MVESLILVGAGASYGAGNIQPSNPPLGSGLFSELEAKFPDHWGALPLELKEEFQEDFEDGMVKLSEQASRLHAPLYQAMGAYFTNFSLGVNTHYEKLIESFRDSISSGRLVLSSLNYDCLLEEAVSNAGIAINYFPREIGESGTVLKPHGSCNFLSKGVKASGGVQFTEGVSFSGGIETVSRREVVEYFRSDSALYPAMALYRPDKHVQIAPDSIHRIQDQWTESVLEADWVGIIGVNPRPSDKHLWDPLAETGAEIYYVGGQDRFQDWQNTHRNTSTDTYLGNRFGECVESIIDEF